MSKDTTAFVGLDVHKETPAVTYAVGWGRLYLASPRQI